MIRFTIVLSFERIFLWWYVRYLHNCQKCGETIFTVLLKISTYFLHENILENRITSLHILKSICINKPIFKMIFFQLKEFHTILMIWNVMYFKEKYLCNIEMENRYWIIEKIPILTKKKFVYDFYAYIVSICIYLNIFEW